MNLYPDDQAIAKALGEEIRRVRKDQGLSQEKLAELIGISKNHMGCFERAEFILNILMLNKIAYALKKKAIGFTIE